MRMSNLERENGNGRLVQDALQRESDGDEMSARCKMANVAVSPIKAGRRGWDTVEV
jgi:hypothetical protein